jgi:phospholipase C
MRLACVVSRRVFPAAVILSVLLMGTLVPAQQDLNSIQHFVFIFKENRTFDNYFGTFPGAEGATTGMISTGEIIPLSRTPDVTPRDVHHQWISSVLSIDNGRMDKFDLIHDGAAKACNVNGDYLCYSQLTEADIPNYFSYAKSFVLSDHFFSSLSGGSFPNHLYTVGAQSGGAITNPNSANSIWGCDSDPGVTVQVLDDAGVASNKFPCFDFPTLADSLQNAGITWKYYAPSFGEEGYQWSALDAIDHIRNTPLWQERVVPGANFIQDAESGNLPAVSWVTPDGLHSEHPPRSSCLGENWTVDMVNAVMHGPDWNSTLIIIVWDDFGGMYDHLPPPLNDQFGLGIRVPMILISPFAKAGTVSHTQYEFSSLLKLVEERFNLPALTARDRDANDMLDALDFTQAPLDPLILPTRQCPLLSRVEMNFRSQRVGTPSPVQNATLSNYGDSPLTVSQVSTAGDYSQTNSCSVVQPGETCKISVTFRPTTTGVRSGVLTVNDSDPNSPQTINLTGLGTQLTLSPTLLTFPATVVGGTSAIQTATLTNFNTASVNISSIQASGDYTQTNNCGTRLAGRASCTLRVSFQPSVAGVRFGTVAINDSDNGSPHTLKLTGGGSFLSWSPKKLTFPSQKLGTSSTPQSFTLTNQGSDFVAISSIVIQDRSFVNLPDYSQTNDCGAGLNAGASCNVAVTFSPTKAGSRPGTVRVFDSEAATSPQEVALAGTGLDGAVVELSPPSLTFPDQNVGSVSSPQRVVLKNTGSLALNISDIEIQGDFAQTNDCGNQLAAGASCNLDVTFAPQSEGQLQGAVVITDDAPNSPQQVSLSGTGIRAAPQVSLSPPSLSFPDQPVNTTSEPQKIALTNTGTADLTIASIAADGDFAQTNTCGPSVAPGGSCDIDVTFTPTAEGFRNGSITITDNADNSPQQAPLSGTGIVVAPIVSLSPPSLTFGDQPVNTSSAPQQITVNNVGNADLVIASIVAEGDFSQVNNCGTGLAPGGSCTIDVTFTPTAEGPRNGSVTITDNAADSPQSAGLSGNGTVAGASLSPPSLEFGDQAVGTSSSPQPIVLTNAGTAPLHIASIDASGAFAQTNDCAPVLAPGSNCTITVTFNPTQPGESPGAITVTDDAPDSPQSAALHGNGVEQ